MVNMRLAVLVPLASAACSLAQAQPVPLTPIQLDIESQPLDSALAVWAKQSGYQVLIPGGNAASGSTAPAVRGKYRSDDALRVLLSSSSYEYSFVNAKTVAIRVAATGAAQAQAASSSSDPPLRLARAASESGGQDISTEPKLQEVLVTAQKRSERLQDVPVPVSAISADSLVSGNQLRLQDYYATAPGFSVSPSPSGSGQQMLSIRGITTGFNTNPTVGVTVDDMPYGSSTNLNGNVVPDIDPNDLARVEVLRGPQGTLYGASSLGGLLKFVTVDPSTERLAGRVQAGINSIENGDNLGYNVRGVVNVPLGDAFAIRASGFTRRDPGYIDNPARSVEGINQADAQGGRVAGLWRPSDVLSVKLSALYQKIDGDGANEVNVQPGLGDLQQNYLPGLGAYEREIEAYSATVTADLGEAELTAITGYNINTFASSVDFTYALGGVTQGFFNQPGAGVFTDGKARKFTQEMRVSLPITDKLEWLVGGFYTRESSSYVEDVWAVTADGARAVDLLRAPAPSIYREYAAFTDLTVHFTDRFDIQFGGRQSKIKQTSETFAQTGELIGPVPALTPRVDSDTDAFTYLVTPRFKISNDLMVYARLASGYRAGGPNYNPDSTVPRQFSPDKTQNYEIGVKGGFSALTYDFSVYRIDWRDLQINLLGPNSLFFTTNAGRARSQGVEVSVELSPISGMRIASWVAYNEAELTEAMPLGSTVAGADGDRLPYSARFSGSLSLDQEFPVTGSLTGFLGGSVNYVDDRQGTFVASVVPRQRYGAYARTDLRAGLRNGSWNANLYITNLTDRRGVIGGGTGNFPPFAFSYIQPRSMGVSIAKTF